MSGHQLIELRHGAFELALCPERGGTITRFSHAGRDLLRPAGEAGLHERPARRRARAGPLLRGLGRPRRNPLAGERPHARDRGFRGATASTEDIVTLPPAGQDPAVDLQPVEIV
jgi:hypothetical protein